jgi:AraC-like DNA-binding protein
MSRFAIDYWQPHAALTGLVSGYHRYAVAPSMEAQRDVFYPAWANLRIKIESGDYRVTIGSTAFDPVPDAAFFGPSSHAAYVETHGGTIVGAGLTPRGYARLIAHPATDFANSVVPLVEALGEQATSLAADLAAAPGDAIKAVFDDFLIARMDAPARDDAVIETLHRLLIDPETQSVETLAQRLGITPRTLNRISNRAFGFAPKMLLRRARFLASLTRVQDHPRHGWGALIDERYHDHAHFVRDSQFFMGMSPSAFLAFKRPMNVASMRARTDILGAPMQALAQPAVSS